jgi:hypothetical protein
MYIFCFTRKSVPIDQKPITFILFGIYGSDLVVEFPTFIQQINLILPNFNNLIRFYFNHRLLQKPFNQMKIARMNDDSSILNKEWVAVLGLAHNELHRFENLRNVYTSITLDYQELYDSLINSGPNSLLVCVFYREG